MGIKARGVGRHVALLRGINVGGNRIVPMARLRELVDGLGVTDVTTYIQSGNVMFSASQARAGGIAEAITDAIEGAFGFRVPVITRSADELAAIAAARPFAAAVDDKNVHVTFFDGEPEAARVSAVDRAAIAPDEFVAVGGELYLHCPAGIGRSKLTNRFFDSFGRTWTVRNWRTLSKLVELTATGS